MTLRELSEDYAYAAQLLRTRLRELRAALRREEDADQRRQLKFRIKQLTPMLQQMNELTELTARYYERGYARNANYTL